MIVEATVRFALPAVSAVNELTRAQALMVHVSTQILKSISACLVPRNDCILASIDILKRAQDQASRTKAKKTALNVRLLAWTPQPESVENAPACFGLKVSNFSRSLFADENEFPSPGALQITQNTVNN